MKKDCFSYHVNLIPNNKISAQPIPENVFFSENNIHNLNYPDCQNSSKYSGFFKWIRLPGLHFNKL